MAGTKTLAQMREELRRKLSETGEDPITWLEKHIAAAKFRSLRTDVPKSKAKARA
jgi:hypothetical protein